ncbi:hypothetical protein AB0904_07085 [Streptomyces sp. NPDC006684]|uniref:hypothetical protein n=1 Tax=Streptomyces sp. NPDC006684 TaxID=3154477 RepID=UPI0034531CEC
MASDETILVRRGDVVLAVNGALEPLSQPLGEGFRMLEEVRGMGVDVMLMQVAQRGTSPKKRRLTTVDVVQDGADLFSTMCTNSKLPMLARVDPYRTRILASADMPQFLSELDATRDLVTGQGELDILEKIRGLAERCTEAAGLELHLEGD